ncbi:MAG: AIR synthase family protein [Nitrososphaerales archaeon]|nr:AIR synthase family protein [Nitrososphaerales archaeon]
MAYASNQLGKVSREFLETVIFRNLGARDQSVLVGPGHGLDNSVLSLSNDRVLILTADPLSLIPALGAKDSAWLTVQLLASDFTTSGVGPQFAMFDFNLPPELDLSVFASYIKAIGAECKKLGVAIVGGHTGKYEGCDFTIIGGGVLLGTAGSDEYLTPAMARVGDKVIMTKGAAIAATGVLARAFPQKVGDELGRKAMRKAGTFVRSCTTVKDALTASALGKGAITGMHDATEGGVLGGLHELSSACGKAVIVNKDKVYVSRETRAVCSLFGLDPLITLSEGTLLITSRPDRAVEVQRKLRRSGIPNFVVGEIDGRHRNGVWVSEGGSAFRRYVPAAVDPYWAAFAEATKRGWA